MSEELIRQPARFTTGVAGLDTVLNGGVICGGLYMLAGQPRSTARVDAAPLTTEKTRQTPAHRRGDSS